jgi:hypothetical protein
MIKTLNLDSNAPQQIITIADIFTKLLILFIVDLLNQKNKSMDFMLFGKKYHGRNMNIEFTRKMLGKQYNEDLHWKENIIAVGGEIIPQLPKHRYIFINAKNKNKLIEDMIYKSQPYPKNQNTNYDASYKPSVQLSFF